MTVSKMKKRSKRSMSRPNQEVTRIGALVSLDKVFDALQVIRLTPAIRKFLKQNDPMALQQADAAVIAVSRNPRTNSE